MYIGIQLSGNPAAGNQLFASSDLVTWTGTPLGNTRNGTIVVCGAPGCILVYSTGGYAGYHYSKDGGVTWTIMNTLSAINSIAYNANAGWICCGYNSTYTCDDPSGTWTTAPNPNTGKDFNGSFATVTG